VEKKLAIPRAPADGMSEGAADGRKPIRRTERTVTVM
jgi:hypothetical protein